VDDIVNLAFRKEKQAKEKAKQTALSESDKQNNAQ
jgi:hypothetical protein